MTKLKDMLKYKEDPKLHSEWLEMPLGGSGVQSISNAERRAWNVQWSRSQAVDSGIFFAFARKKECKKKLAEFVKAGKFESASLILFMARLADSSLQGKVGHGHGRGEAARVH